MNRRRFLQALFAVPCLGAPLLVPTVVEMPPVVFESGWLKVPVVDFKPTHMTWVGETKTYVFTWTPGGSWVQALPGDGG